MREWRNSILSKGSEFIAAPGAVATRRGNGFAKLEMNFIAAPS
jgi:hypothetical protein